LNFFPNDITNNDNHKLFFGIVFFSLCMFGYSNAFAQSTSTDVIIKDIIPPTADAGADITASELSTISLDGTASNDGPNQITFHWKNLSEFPMDILNVESPTPLIIIPKTDTPRIIPFEVTISDGTNQSTDIVNLTIETRPRIVISTAHYDKGSISQINNATYTITPHPYTGADSMSIHQNMISDSQYPLEKLDANFTNTNPFKQLYYTGDLAADDVLPGKYSITISGHGTSNLFADSVILHAENSHVSVASFVSYSDIMGDMGQTISVPSPDINTDGTSAIVKLNMTVGNDTMSSLPSITLMTNSTQKVSAETITISSGLSKITNSTIPKGNDIMDALSIPAYTLPAISNVTSILPPISISNDNINVIMSPPVKSWVAGQQIVIPISDVTHNNLISEIRFASSADSGGENSEWLGVQLDNSMPESLPSLPNSETSLFLDIKYPAEEGLGGVDWSNPENHYNAPQITIHVTKPHSSDAMEKNSSGCAVYNVYLYEDTAKIWNQNSGGIILSNEPINSDTCKVVMSFEHFSSYGLSSVSSSVSSGTSVQPSSSGSGRTGVNVSSSSIGSPTSSDGIARIQEIKENRLQNYNDTKDTLVPKQHITSTEKTISNNKSATSLSSSLKQQITDGTSHDDIVCKGDYNLVFKLSDGSPACVKSESAPKLIERGWAKR
jgi:hypothetical protein